MWYLSSGMSIIQLKVVWSTKHRGIVRAINDLIIRNYKEKKKRKRKLDAEIENGNEMSDSAMHRSKRQSIDSSAEKNICIFCEKKTGKPHEYSTFSSGNTLKNMALEMQDTTLMAKLSAGDVIAIEAKYHLQCLTAYRNKYRSFLRQHKRQPDLFKERCKARAFAELVAHVDELLEAGNFLFKCSVLHNLYEQRLKEFGVDIAINKTRLKEKLLEHFSDMGLQEQYDGRNTVLLFPEGMQQVLKDAHLDHDYDNEALLLTKVARICRQEILSVDTTFSGSFAVDCQRDITPITNQLVSMILYGPNIKDKSGEPPILSHYFSAATL